MRRLVYTLLLCCLAAAPAGAVLRKALLANPFGWVLTADGIRADIDLQCSLNRGYVAGTISPVSSLLSVTRTQTNATTTNLLPSSPSGAAFNTYAANVLRIDNNGCLVEETRTNQLHNSNVPVTQTTASLAIGTYTLWVNGSGSATMSAGTGTGCGTSVATQGSPVTVVITVAGTCTVTVSGSLNAFQLELGTFGTSLIITTGSTGVRGGDVLTYNTTTGANFTLYGEGSPYAPAAYTTIQTTAAISDGTVNEYARVHRNAASAAALGFIIGTVSGVGGTTIYNTGTGTWTQFANSKNAVAFTTGSQRMAFNGALASAGSTASASVPGIIRINIGSRQDSSQFWNGYVKRVAAWLSARISDTGLQTVTTP